VNDKLIKETQLVWIKYTRSRAECYTHDTEVSMFVQQSRPLACKDFVNNYTTYLWDQSPLVCRKVKGWWVGKSKRKSSKCNSSAASCGIGTVDGGARGLRTDHAASSRLSRALS
jgi:hypothetical protein